MLKPDSATTIRQGEELDQTALQAYLKSQIPDFEDITEILQFPGGFSNLTYLIKTATKEYVLRRPPFGANIKSAHDMGREFRVLSLLKPHYNKVPTPTIYCEDESVMGAKFYMMERVQGIILRAGHAYKLPSMIDADILETTMQHLGESFVDNFAALHTIDIEKTGLIALGKPEGYVDRQVDGWIGRYAKSKTDEIPEMETAAEWMMSHKPAPQPPAFLHNDYKFDNVVLNPDDLSEILAVLDWEMSTVGDPLMDLGGSLAYWSEETDGVFARNFNLTWLKGNLTRKELVARYAEKTGRDVSEIIFYYVFGLYKNAVIAQQIYARWKAGLTKDSRFESLILGVKEFAEMAVKAIKTGSV